jgi:hypothetical protein
MCTGISPGNSPLQGLVNCLKEIPVPGPQKPEAGSSLLLSLPGLSVLRQTRVEEGPGSPPQSGESLGTWLPQAKGSLGPGKL